MKRMIHIEVVKAHGWLWAVRTLLIAMLVVTVVGCRKEPSTLYPWGWERLGRPTDSLMLPLQEAFLGDTSLDSCAALVNRFQEYASRPDALDIEKARAIFWDARLAFASGNVEEAHGLFRKALAAIDSVRYPFDARYIHLCLEPLEGKVLDGSRLDWDWYLSMTDDLDYSLRHDARIFGALRAQYLSCFMTYSGNPSRALRYALLADSLFTGVGRDGDRLTNRLNVASNRILTGDTVGAIKDFAWMQAEIDRGVPPVSPLLVPLIDYNKWVVSADTTALHRLKMRTRGNPDLRGYDALASAYLAEIELKRGDTDSLRSRVRDMEAGLDYTDDATQKAFLLKVLGRSCEALGDHAAAYRYLNQYPDVAEENVTALSGDRYSVAENEREISRIEQHQEKERVKARMRLYALLAGVAVVIAVLVWLTLRRLRVLRREKDLDRRELEKAKRSELAMSLSVHEKARQIEELHRKVCQLADDGIINADASNRLESSIISEQGASKADEEFGRVFSTLSPDFHRRLRERYPRIGRNTLRMAEYIAIGMDNRHIARVMNIRQESVKQNRWRLRKALGLDTDDSLDRHLREML